MAKVPIKDKTKKSKKTAKKAVKKTTKVVKSIKEKKPKVNKYENDLPEDSEVIEYEPKNIGDLKNPVFIVGLGPGLQRKGEKTHLAWEGNRSADLVQEAIKGLDNIYLTNVMNYYVKGEITAEIISKGVDKLRRDINKLKPSKIICMGDFAFNHIRIINPPGEVIKFKHPSYLIRFQKPKDPYIKELKAAIKG